jgi:ATP-binding cassette subfamily B multidrug efflux pump
VRHDHLVDEVEARGYDARLMRRLLAWLRPYRWQVAAAVGLLLVMTPLELAGPWLIKLAIDRVVSPGAAGFGSGLGLWAIGLLFLLSALLLLGVRFVQAYLTRWVGQRAMLDLRTALFSRTLRLPLARFDRTPVGTLMTRVGSDVEVLNEMFSSGVVDVFGDVALLLGIVGVMLWMNPRLALIAFTVIPILFAATMMFRGRVRRAFRVIRQKVAAMNARLQETITGIGVIQLFGREPANRARYEQVVGEHQAAYERAIFYYAVFFPAVEVIGALATALILWYGGGKVAAGAMTVGSLVAFLEYGRRFFTPVQDLSEKYNILQSAMAASERIFSLLDYPVESETRGGPPDGRPPAGPGHIRFEGVTFAYGDGPDVLRDVTFEARPGERVAIVGPTGAGKTSIISLLGRLYEPTAGRITLDGVDTRDIPLPELRRRVGVVLQDVFLFSGTVVENVMPAEEEVDEKRVREVLQAAGALAMFERLPEGLATPLRERASLVSTGQKQLLAFARALAYDPPVIVLDEATSSLDADTEGKVQAAMERLLAGRTALIIAHRLSTVRGADRIVVIRRGRVAEMGTHRELLALRGVYWRLHRIQFGLPE